MGNYRVNIFIDGGRLQVDSVVVGATGPGHAFRIVSRMHQERCKPNGVWLILSRAFRI